MSKEWLNSESILIYRSISIFTGIDIFREHLELESLTHIGDHYMLNKYAVLLGVMHYAIASNYTKILEREERE